jgi:hypothetical protein
MNKNKLIIQDKGCGLVLFENTFDINQKFLFEYIEWLKQEEENTFTYVEENGKTFAVNKTGFRFDVNSVSLAPERFIDPLCRMSDRKPTKEQIELINQLELLMYDVLVEYCKLYPEAATVCWWRIPGHIATYTDGQQIGPHCDDQISYEFSSVSRNEYPKHSKLSINIYLNTGVEEESSLDGTTYTGGDIYFKYAKYKHKPKMGDILIYPANFIGTHEVAPVLKGKRIAYLGACLYGTPEHFSPKPIESDHRIWLLNLKKDVGLE